MTINNALSICFKNDIKVFPELNKVTKKWQIKATLKDKPMKTFKKELRQKDINDAVTKVYIYYANKL